MPYQSMIRYVRDQYHIDGESTGCIAPISAHCRNFYTDKIIEKKYGKGFWKKINHEADSLGELGLLDRYAFYKGGSEKFVRDFAAIFRKLYPNNKLSTINIDVRLTLDITGKILAIEDGGTYTKHYQYADAVIRQMPAWQPEITMRKPTQSEVHVVENCTVRKRR
jgi:hypothetical protein